MGKHAVLFVSKDSFKLSLIKSQTTLPGCLSPASMPRHPTPGLRQVSSKLLLLFFTVAGSLSLNTLRLLCLLESTWHPKPKPAVSGLWRDSIYRWCLYLQLEHVERELRLVGPQGFLHQQSHARALKQLHALKGHLWGQPGTPAIAYAR